MMQIATLATATGQIGICPLPGRMGDYAQDLAAVLGWSPSLVVSLTEGGEMKAKGGDGLPADLAASGVAWLNLPIPDFGTPPATMRAGWAAISAKLRQEPRLLVHCMGGCGRSGMIVLRLLIEMGEMPEAALKRLREARPCAVETKAQMRWALAA